MKSRQPSYPYGGKKAKKDKRLGRDRVPTDPIAVAKSHGTRVIPV